jgi:hypothetical protein
MEFTRFHDNCNYLYNQPISDGHAPVPTALRDSELSCLVAAHVNKHVKFALDERVKFSVK